jgi:hypothetical protein
MLIHQNEPDALKMSQMLTKLRQMLVTEPVRHKKK